MKGLSWDMKRSNWDTKGLHWDMKGLSCDMKGWFGYERVKFVKKLKLNKRFKLRYDRIKLGHAELS